MSDRLAATIAQKFKEAAPKFANAFHADTYELLEVTMVKDPYGGSKPDPDPPVVETGYCALIVVNRESGLRLEGGIVLTETAYQVEIKPPTIISTKHQIRINGRTFEVKDVMRGGEMEMFVVAAIEEAEVR